MNPTKRDLLLEIADLVKWAAGEGNGFALFLHIGEDWSYVSNGDRPSVVTALAEWLVRTSFGDSSGPGSALDLELRCARIGKLIGQADTKFILFLFTMSEESGPGDFAYITNAAEARAGVAQWVKNEKR